MFVNVKKGSIVSDTPGMGHGGMARYVQLGCAADGVFKELSDIFYKNKWFIFKYVITYYVLL